MLLVLGILGTFAVSRFARPLPVLGRLQRIRIRGVL
jgi:hypothetical protein